MKKNLLVLLLLAVQISISMASDCGSLGSSRDSIVSAGSVHSLASVKPLYFGNHVEALVVIDEVAPASQIITRLGRVLIRDQITGFYEDSGRPGVFSVASTQIGDASPVVSLPDFCGEVMLSARVSHIVIQEPSVQTAASIQATAVTKVAPSGFWCGCFGK